LEQLARLEAAGAETFILGEMQVDLPAVLESLGKLGFRRLMVEGGGTLIAELFRHGLVDELSIYTAPIIFGGASAPTLTDGPGFSPEQSPRLRLALVKKLGNDGGILVRYHPVLFTVIEQKE
jgi:2,5-diamino-6-(ribosylamino)-4(3H)-pyrimidinone 5'-phosphate reductase